MAVDDVGSEALACELFSRGGVDLSSEYLGFSLALKVYILAIATV